MPRHRAPLDRLHYWVRRVVFSIAVLAGSTAAGLLAAGAIWLAIQLPGPQSPDRVIWPPPSITGSP